MTSVVAICNMALDHVSKPNISSLTEMSEEARVCSRVYTQARDALLSLVHWRFAGASVSLAAVTNTKAGVWGYAYQRPSDCLRIRLIRPEYSTVTPQGDFADPLHDPHPYEMEAQTVYCNLSPAIMRYTQRVEDAERLPPLFVDALAAQIASRIALPLTRDVKLRNDMYNLARQLAAAAAEQDANEQRETSDIVSGFVGARD